MCFGDPTGFKLSAKVVVAGDGGVAGDAVREESEKRKQQICGVRVVVSDEAR